MDKIFTDEGYVSIENEKLRIENFTYNYVLTDHLGHTRSVVSSSGEVLQEHAYYPYGLEIGHLSMRGDYGYLYTGKEHLAFGGVNWYDHHARYFDGELGIWRSIDPALQMHSPYVAMGMNPMMYVDINGEWAGWDDLIVGGIGFIYGYLSYGFTTGDWGWEALGNGVLSAGMFILGYYTGGATSTSTVSQGLSFAAKNVAISTVNMAMPSVAVPVGDNTSMNLSVGFGMGGNGLSVGGNVGFAYDDGTTFFGVGLGVWGNNKGNHYGGKFSYNYKDVGASYGLSKYGGDDAQLVGAIGLRVKDFTTSYSNDFFGDKGDRWRTTGLELGYKGLIIGTTTYTNEGEKESGGAEGVNNRKSPMWGKNGGKFGAWFNGKIHSQPLYIGYTQGNQTQRAGFQSRKAHDFTQNGNHRGWIPFPTGNARQNYYLDYQFQGGEPYYYTGYHNPFSLW